MDSGQPVIGSPLGSASVVILSTADFQSSVWTNKQHLAVRLAQWFPLVYIESLGLRRPAMTASDATRLLRRLLGRGRSAGQATGDRIPERLTIVSPLVLPFHGTAAARRINRLLIGLLVRPRLPKGPWVLWTFSPLTYGLESSAAAVVYHSVDLLHTQERSPTEALLAAERNLVGRADVCIASSSGVERHLREQGASDVRLWENVADLDLFRLDPSGRQPRAVFAGNITSTKVDLQALLDVADRGVPLAVAGPIGIDGSAKDPLLEALLAHPHVTYLGNLSPAELAAEVRSSSVGLIPYRLNEYTAGVYPMKVFEYLGAGLSVVSTPLPSLVERHVDGVVFASAEGFGSVVRGEVDRFSEQAAEARSIRAQPHSWSERSRDAAALIRELAG